MKDCVVTDKRAVGASTTRVVRPEGVWTPDVSHGFRCCVVENSLFAHGAKKPGFAKLWCENSGADVTISTFTAHPGKERFPGMTSTYALTQMFEKIAEKYDKAMAITKARVGVACAGCVYEKCGVCFKDFGPCDPGQWRMWC